MIISASVIFIYAYICNITISMIFKVDNTKFQKQEYLSNIYGKNKKL